MERILLVEPNYKNKYPPIGLMKISTYYKSKGDFVQFHKGLLPSADIASFDRIFVTTLFTFDFDMCVETIRYYIAIAGIKKVFVGGIAATIIPNQFEAAIPGIHILKGQLTSSNALGYNDDVNIDILELDYDILWDIPYDYPAADSYFIYTSRGCPRKCSFCAVKTLEPTFYECQNVKEQIERVDARFGKKKNLLIMDNNILFAPHLAETIQILVNLGFGVANNSTKKNNEMSAMIRSLYERRKIGKSYIHLLQRIKRVLTNIKETRISNADKEKLNPIQQLILDNKDSELLTQLHEQHQYLIDFFERYNYHKIKRYVDFNQGLDARLFTLGKAQLLSQIALKPCRIAFDDINTQEEYLSAMSLAVNSGILHFSNYLLFNYKDDPKDLWNRLFLNVDFCNKHPEIKSLFSFPMKYASIEYTDRSYIGALWNKKYLKSINVILNVTSGVVAKENDFFFRAFGRNVDEYLEILTMPDDYIRYRDYFEKNGLIQHWTEEYRKLTYEQRGELIEILSAVSTETTAIERKHSAELNRILLFYTIKKNKMEQAGSYYLQRLGTK
ncbi:MAG: hypothetical protein Q3985_03650 [Eubacteriales bacterium]|nr:hypothetical protein [Eubacteriales bacterium]